MLQVPLIHKFSATFAQPYRIRTQERHPIRKYILFPWTERACFWNQIGFPAWPDCLSLKCTKTIWMRRKYITGLQITVDDAICMQVFHCSRDIQCETYRKLQIKSVWTDARQVLVKSTTSHKLSNYYHRRFHRGPNELLQQSSLYQHLSILKMSVKKSIIICLRSKWPKWT